MLFVYSCGKYHDWVSCINSSTLSYDYTSKTSNLVVFTVKTIYFKHGYNKNTLLRLIREQPLIMLN